MFTGIIEQKGKVKGLKKVASNSYILTVETPDNWQPQEGQSIAVNGACLTVVSNEKNAVSFDVMPETVDKTAFKRLKSGEEVNLERAMAADGRFEGHIVQGHVDDVGTISGKIQRGNSWTISIRTGKDFSRNLVDKGSVAVDGISLTVSKILNDGFEVSIIPLTAEKTTLGFKKAGDYVNLEADVLGKYILKFMKKKD